MVTFISFQHRTYCQSKSDGLKNSLHTQTSHNTRQSAGNTNKSILPRHNEGFAITAQPVQAASGSEEQRMWCYPQLKYSVLLIQ